jgi:hypothetical protein
MKYVKLIALLLVYTTLLGAFAACNSAESNSTTPHSSSGTIAPEAPSSTTASPETPTLPQTTCEPTASESPETTVPAPETTVPAPETTVPAPETTVPAPETTVPAPETTVPAPETTVPAPETTVPAPETTVPAPETTVPAPETTHPEPEPEPEPEQLVVYKNGKYQTNIILKNSASDSEKDDLSALQDIFNNVLGKKPASLTDTDKGASAPAIIIGKTRIAESDSVYKNLGENEAVAQFINNKYVIAYTSPKSYVMLIKKIEDKLRDCAAKNPDSIIIDDSWNIKLSASDVLGYEVNKLQDNLELPLYNGKTFTTSNIDLGQGSLMHVATRTGRIEYEQYIEDLKKAGFVFYTGNNIGGNKYATLLTKTQIVNVMFFQNKGEVRVTVDDRAQFDLTGLKSDNIYKEVTAPSLTVIGIGESGYPGGMGYVYKLSDGRFFIIDGGITRDEECKNKDKCSAEWLYYTLRELADDPDNIVIAGWLLTHIHNDHVGAFIDMAKDTKCTSRITVQTVIYSQPNDAHMAHVKKLYRAVWIPNALELWKPERVIKAHPGQVLYFADLTINILGSQDLILPGTIDSHNNMSIVSMVEFKGYDALYLADAEGLLNNQLKTIYSSDLKCDILQLAHHGYDNTNAGVVYAYTKPSIVFWPVSAGHYDGSGGAYVKGVSFNKQFFAEGITNHVAGETNMTIKNFDTWVPEPRWNPMP